MHLDRLVASHAKLHNTTSPALPILKPSCKRFTKNTRNLSDKSNGIKGITRALETSTQELGATRAPHIPPRPRTNNHDPCCHRNDTHHSYQQLPSSKSFTCRYRSWLPHLL